MFSDSGKGAPVAQGEIPSRCPSCAQPTELSATSFGATPPSCQQLGRGTDCATLSWDLGKPNRSQSKVHVCSECWIHTQRFSWAQNLGFQKEGRLPFGKVRHQTEEPLQCSSPSALWSPGRALSAPQNCKCEHRVTSPPAQSPTPWLYQHQGVSSTEQGHYVKYQLRNCCSPATQLLPETKQVICWNFEQELKFDPSSIFELHSVFFSNKTHIHLLFIYPIKRYIKDAVKICI